MKDDDLKKLLKDSIETISLDSIQNDIYNATAHVIKISNIRAVREKYTKISIDSFNAAKEYVLANSDGKSNEQCDEIRTAFLEGVLMALKILEVDK